MDTKGFDLSIVMILSLIITFLTLYGPFTLLFFLPVPFYLLFMVLIQRISAQNQPFVSKIIPPILRNRGPPQTELFV
jgi:ABC-type multidrug transport system fused ATPase/permease subunit